MDADLGSRDWKRFPLTVAEARTLRQRSDEERCNDLQSLRHNWKWVVLDLFAQFVGGTVLGVGFGLVSVLWALSKFAL